MATSYTRADLLLLLLLYCYVLFPAICSSPRAAALLSFDYNFSVPGDLARANLLYMGDSSNASDRINLTYLTKWSTGRVAHRQLVRLWEDRTGKAASFHTSFSFAIDRNSTDQADGMAFFVGAPQESLPPATKGGFLGLIPNVNGSDSPRTVGVEFDTCRNDAWDPPSIIDHIGVDVNNIKSSNYKALEDLTLGTMWAEIRYDAHSTTMTVTLRAKRENYRLETAVDLKAAGLPQDAAVGFSAATGELIESHQLLSWSFNSTENNQPSSGVDETSAEEPYSPGEDGYIEDEPSEDFPIYEDWTY